MLAGIISITAGLEFSCTRKYFAASGFYGQSANTVVWAFFAIPYLKLYLEGIVFKEHQVEPRVPRVRVLSINMQ